MLSLPLLRAKSRSPVAEPFPQGIQILCEPPDASIDVVFVHGLTGDRLRTWTSQRTSVMWPEKLLPAELPDARILTFGYDAYIIRLGLVSTNRIGNHASDLLSALTSVRDSRRSQRPLIFVAHSLGGLVIKDALLKSRDSPDAHLRTVYQYTRGIAFMGTPHSGSSLAAWAKLPAKCLGAFKQTNTSLLSVLETDSEVLGRIQHDFLSMLRTREIGGDPIAITCFYESLPLPGIGLIVTPDSAILPGFNHISIHADHREMTRFSLKSDPGFVNVVGELKRWAENCRPQHQNSDSADLSTYELKCLHLLAYADMESRLYAIDDPERDTCQWLFSNSKYQQWLLRQDLDLSHGLLWIKGKPGSGKSTLMKHAFLKTKSDVPASRCISLGFFFNARGAAIEKTPDGLYRSLVHQLIQQCPDVRSVFTARCKEKERQAVQEKMTWSLPELRSFFHSSIVRGLGKPVKIFIDALDECDEEEVRDTIRRFERSAADAFSGGKVLYVCWSSRHYPHISISHGFELRMEDLNNTDIKTFVHQQLVSFTTVNLQDLEKEIVERASGVFLWISLAIRMLFRAVDRGQSKGELLATLKQLPPKLDDLFNDIFMSVEERDRYRTINLMRWVMFAVRPMTTSELRVALALTSTSHQSFDRLNGSSEMKHDSRSFKRYILETSAGMCEVVAEARQKSGIVQVIHESVRDFFLSDKTCKGLKYRSRKEFEAESNQRLFLSCKQYICMDNFCKFPPWKRTSSRHRSFEYVDKTTTAQNPSIESIGSAMTTEDASVDFIGKAVSAKDGSPAPAVPPVDRKYKQRAPHGMLKICAFWKYADHNVFTHAEAAECAGLAQTPSVFELLLQRWLWITADPGANHQRDNKGIQWAIKSGKVQPADLEKAFKCRQGLHPWLATLVTERKEELGHHQPGEVLSAAAHAGLDNFILSNLDFGAVVNSTASAGQTALHEASSMGHSTVIHALVVSKGADLEARDADEKTAICNAARTGGPEAVRTLINLGALIDAKDGYSTTPLMEAAKAGRVASVGMLLERGADIEARNGFSQTPLAIACLWGHAPVADVLVRRHAELESADKEGNTPLSNAAQYGHIDVMELLLAAGANHQACNRFNVPVTGWSKTSEWPGWPHLRAKNVNVAQVNDDVRAFDEPQGHRDRD